MNETQHLFHSAGELTRPLQWFRRGSLADFSLGKDTGAPVHLRAAVSSRERTPRPGLPLQRHDDMQTEQKAAGRLINSHPYINTHTKIHNDEWAQERRAGRSVTKGKSWQQRWWELALIPEPEGLVLINPSHWKLYTEVCCTLLTGHWDLSNSVNKIYVCVVA